MERTRATSQKRTNLCRVIYPGMFGSFRRRAFKFIPSCRFEVTRQSDCFAILHPPTKSNLDKHHQPAPMKRRNPIQEMVNPVASLKLLRFFLVLSSLILLASQALAGTMIGVNFQGRDGSGDVACPA